MAQGQKEACSQALRIISCRLISCHRLVSHAQMHADFKGRNPGPYSGLVSFVWSFSDSGHVHILWTYRHSFRQFPVLNGAVSDLIGPLPRMP